MGGEGKLSTEWCGQEFAIVTCQDCNEPDVFRGVEYHRECPRCGCTSFTVDLENLADDMAGEIVSLIMGGKVRIDEGGEYSRVNCRYIGWTHTTAKEIEESESLMAEVSETVAFSLPEEYKEELAGAYDDREGVEL